MVSVEPAVSMRLPASRRAEPEPSSGRASKLWLRTARVVDIGYYLYREPFGGAGKGHKGFLGTSPDPIHFRVNRVGKGLKRPT